LEYDGAPLRRGVILQAAAFLLILAASLIGIRFYEKDTAVAFSRIEANERRERYGTDGVRR
jgi:uncharacterized membrane protein required for colicin V production